MRVVESSPANFKVTTPHDLRVAELLPSVRCLTRAMLTDYHVHLRPDDPSTTPPSATSRAANAERYREVAAERGDRRARRRRARPPLHAPRSTSGSTRSGARTRVDDLDAYVRFVREETDLRLGIEADFVPGREDRMANLLERARVGLRVGSVHFLGDHAVDIDDETDVWRHETSPSGSGSATSRRSRSPR